ncbi:MAG TPA: ABC transporter ATP-binding protein [Candidatus Hydrogenedentes bacterium]|nr:ABC transporter ATP-binding protein [Candidatus Hydrogenedentota bacterium]
MNDTAICIQGLLKRFKTFTLGPLNASVPLGAIYGFIGPNGAGKTTTIDLIMGMGHEDEGTIRVLGLDHRADEAAMKAQIGYVSPEVSFNAWVKVKRVIGFYRSFYPDWDDAYCEELMRRLKLDWQDRIATLSYGSRTKLNLVIALSHRPKLLLLDEPLSGLDALAKQEVFSELLSAVQDEDRTVFISSHNLDDIERFTDHLGMIQNGKMLLEGPTADLVERFRMVDGISNNGYTITSLAGVRIQSREGERCRILVDTKKTPLQALSENGVQILADSPVSLEELFVGIMKEN